jgi:hypothetical protein
VFICGLHCMTIWKARKLFHPRVGKRPPLHNAAMRFFDISPSQLRLEFPHRAGPSKMSKLPTDATKVVTFCPNMVLSAESACRFHCLCCFLGLGPESHLLHGVVDALPGSLLEPLDGRGDELQVHIVLLRPPTSRAYHNILQHFNFSHLVAE